MWLLIVILLGTHGEPPVMQTQPFATELACVKTRVWLQTEFPGSLKANCFEVKS